MFCSFSSGTDATNKAVVPAKALHNNNKGPPSPMPARSSRIHAPDPLLLLDLLSVVGNNFGLFIYLHSGTYTCICTFTHTHAHTHTHPHTHILKHASSARQAIRFVRPFLQHALMHKHTHRRARIPTAGCSRGGKRGQGQTRPRGWCQR